ncbi:class I SAM-dependent methyltransferase [Candidatus Haliotispira prima]|uniref:Class I SAM-dependent methyltransferase n=1 Tax=Candidatus Haliotispira prima TaxID=3034016 RepID=A0ABY8MHM3_9SPIO|nr:class I SAM-dependent methyltransferase [Candidatus Haliotispira prima]
MQSIPPLRTVDMQNAAQKRSYTRGVFAILASVYKRNTAIFSFGRDRIWKRLLIAALPAKIGEDRLGTNALCLDLACGTGDITGALAQRYPQAKILGLDLSEDMITEARRALKEKLAELPGADQNICLELGDMSALSREDNSVDLLTAGYALPNATDLDQALGEMFRVLKPGAAAAFLDMSKSRNTFLAAVQCALLKSWGTVCGLILHGKPGVYTYLAENLQHFPNRRDLPLRLESNGFSDVSTRPLMGGFMALVVCRKAEAT